MILDAKHNSNYIILDAKHNNISPVENIRTVLSHNPKFLKVFVMLATASSMHDTMPVETKLHCSMQVTQNNKSIKYHAAHCLVGLLC